MRVEVLGCEHGMAGAVLCAEDVMAAAVMLLRLSLTRRSSSKRLLDASRRVSAPTLH